MFPSITSKRTGLIIRKQVRKSPLKIKGFDWKQGARYVVINRRYTSDLECLWNILPWRRKVTGTAPGIKSKELNSKKGDVELQWQFPRAKPTEIQERELIARVAEIATRAIFENFTYKFAGEMHHQASGGPIGARVTMAAARIVMHDWGETYHGILEAARLETAILTGYVDDVRQGGQSMRMGMRYDEKAKQFTWSQGAKEEDRRLRVLEKESTNARMRRICMPAINNINQDLEFTAELPEEFAENKLPTLDFLLWLEKHGLLNHSYFEKSMKTPYVLMNMSAMGSQQKYSILSNELVRKLSSVQS